MRLSIIIPCFNEAETIRAVVERVLSAPLPEGWERELIVVDDGSAEATKTALKRIETEGHPVTIVSRLRNGGKGAAVKDGLRRVSGDFVLIQDADLEYNPDEYPLLLEPLRNRPGVSVFGTRRNSSNNVPYSRVYFYGGLLVTKIYNFLFRTNLSDIATCYKVFSVERVPALLQSSHDDFVFDAVDLTHELLRAGEIVEVPISYIARSKKTGKKLNWSHGLDIVLALFLARLGIPSRLRARVARVVRFVISGGTAAVVSVGLLYVLTEYAGLWYLYSAAISFVASFLVSFMLQKYWAFRNRQWSGAHLQMAVHLTVACLNFFLNLGLIYVFTEYGHVWYVLSQVIASVLIAFESYFAFRWIYRQSEDGILDASRV